VVPPYLNQFEEKWNMKEKTNKNIKNSILEGDFPGKSVFFFLSFYKNSKIPFSLKQSPMWPRYLKANGLLQRRSRAETQLEFPTHPDIPFYLKILLRDKKLPTLPTPNFVVTNCVAKLNLTFPPQNFPIFLSFAKYRNNKLILKLWSIYLHENISFI
jgi:hypothetical protein